MTLTELITMCRQRHNSVGDTFWSDDEIRGLIYAGCNEMAREAKVIEGVYTTSTVVGQQEYSYPTQTISIKRVTYAGAKLQPITFREDDQITGLNAGVTSQGTPQYYAVWNDTIYLRPLPAAVGTLKIFSYNEPQALTSVSTLEIPSQYHADIVSYVLFCMHAKEKNFDGATYWRDEWDERLLRIKVHQRKRLRGDSFTNVNDIDTMGESFIGTI
jgi:hypothetical protein